jgi:hypothetical protein
MGEPASTTDPDLYQPWVRLHIHHGFHASPDGVRRDLQFRPTPSTGALMRRHQMVLLEEPDGFSLLVKPSRLAELEPWLRSTNGGPLQLRLWGRSARFWGVTALPLQARSQAWQLYGSTRQASGLADLAPPMRCLAVQPQLLRLTLPRRARSLRLLDGAGQLLLEQPLSKEQVKAGEVGIDLTDLPEGLIQASFDQGPSPEAILHLPQEPGPVGLFSLWLDPARASDGEAIHWQLEARSTLWQYLVVPRQAGDQLEELAISGDGSAFQPQAAPELLPDGRQAWRLVAQTALPLAEQSPYRFRLEGQRLGRDGQRQRLLLDPLPVAAAEPVWPAASGQPLLGLSEIVVPV